MAYKGAEGFPTNEITVNVASTNSCSNAGLTASSLLTHLESAMDKFWNQVSESALVLKIGELKSIDIDGDSLTDVANKAANNTILVGCNDDISSFSGGFTGAVGGLACSSTVCKGAVIVNTHSNTNVDTYSEDTLQRYDTKALGIYLAASKNWLSPFGNGNIGLHSGLNYSFLETNDGDEDLNLFFGLDLELNPEFSILLEYNSALNENDMTAETMSISKGGYLNAAVRWSFVESLHLELDLNNLLFDDEKVEYFKREIKITYIEYF